MSLAAEEQQPPKDQATVTGDRRGAIAAGAKAGVPFALAGGVLAFSFGVVARPVMDPWRRS